MIVEITMSISTDNEEFENSWHQDDLASAIGEAIWMRYKPLRGDGFDYEVELSASNSREIKQLITRLIDDARLDPDYFHTADEEVGATVTRLKKLLSIEIE